MVSMWKKKSLFGALALTLVLSAVGAMGCLTAIPELGLAEKASTSMRVDPNPCAGMRALADGSSGGISARRVRAAHCWGSVCGVAIPGFCDVRCPHDAAPLSFLT